MRHARRLVVIGIENHYGRQILKGVHDYCRLHGRWDYQLVGNSSPEALMETREIVRHWKADGIIAPIRTDRIARMMRSFSVPIVNVSNTRMPEWPSVFSDSIVTGQMGARYFLDNGFRQFGFASLEEFERSTQLRCEGFVNELAKAGFVCNVFNVQSKRRPPASAWLAIRVNMSRWLRSIARPVALMCAHDSYAAEILWACQRVGRRVPEDVALLGIGNQEAICQMFTPTLSSVEINARQIGFESARLVHRLMDGAAAPRDPILIRPTKVVMRQSTDVVATDDADMSAAVRYIRNHAQDPMNIKDILGQVAISRKTMERRFKELLGRTPRAEIARVRLDRVKNLLAESDLPIKAVARNSGFSSARMLDRFFRRSLGLTPMQYRRNMSSPTGEGFSRSGEATHTNDADHTHKPGNGVPAPSREQRRRLDELASPSRSYSRLESAKMKGIILALCQETFLTAAKVGEFLHRNPKGIRERFLKPMLDEGLLLRKYPGEPSRPDQAYTAKPQTRPTENTGAIP